MEHKKAYRVLVDIINNSPDCIGEPCYVTGNFNNWTVDGCLAGYIPPVGKHVQVELTGIEEGSLELKLTRGDWSTLCSDPKGRLMPPFTIEVTRDIRISLAIDAWRDKFSISTASPQVHLLNERFYFPQLRVYRPVWIYLPADYEISGKRYPVIYMHDGQHLFDEATSVGRAGPVEWMVDETIDASPDDAIVVGIAHAPSYGEREAEYRIGEETDCRGELYLADIVDTLKPYIDHHFRSCKESRSTAMVGSSLGGLLTLYAGVRYHSVFGTLGVFSPSLWMGHSLYEWLRDDSVRQALLQNPQHYYFYAGDKEVRRDEDRRIENMADEMKAFVQFFKDNNSAMVCLDIDTEGRHGALYWQKAFVRFFAWWSKQDIY